MIGQSGWACCLSCLFPAPTGSSPSPTRPEATSAAPSPSRRPCWSRRWCFYPFISGCSWGPSSWRSWWLALTSIYAPNGWLGRYADLAGLKIAFTPIGIWLALVFVSLPFIVRTVQPVLAEVAREEEEASATLGAGRLTTFVQVILPALTPAMLTGFSLALARSVGEYGSVIFIAGNIPYVSEIAPLLIVIKLEEYDYAGATAIATVMLVISFAMLLLINLTQSWSRRRFAHA